MTAPNNISPIHSVNEKALMLAISSQLARNKAVPPHPTHSASARWAAIRFASLGALLQCVVELPLALLLQQIVELLERQEGIQIARRTVAKYREVLGILASSKRKKMF